MDTTMAEADLLTLQALAEVVMDAAPSTSTVLRMAEGIASLLNEGNPTDEMRAGVRAFAAAGIALTDANEADGSWTAEEAERVRNAHRRLLADAS